MENNIIKYFDEFKELYEKGLIKTDEAETVYNSIYNSLSLLGINMFGSKFTKNNIILKINDLFSIDKPLVEILFNHISSFVINRGGWFPSKMLITNKFNMNNEVKYSLDDILNNCKYYKTITITYEKKFDEIETLIPEILYHLSIEEYNKKILKYGLFPKSKSKLSAHLDRIYLCASIQDCKDLINQMSFFYYGQNGVNTFKNTTPVMYEIDNSSHNAVKNLYKDPNYKKGFYTLNNILPKYIKRLDI